MIKFRIICLLVITFCFLPLAHCAAPFTSVTATVTDSDAQTWNNCSWGVTFIPNPAYPNSSTYNYNGVSITSLTYNSYLQQNGSCNGAGALTVTLLDNVAITPGGSSWRFTIKPNASVAATVYSSLPVSGSSLSLSSFLSANSVVIRFPASRSSDAYGYSDTEVNPVPVPGGQYFNVITATTRQWTGSIWQSIIGGTGAYLPINGGTLTGSLTDTFGFIGPLTGLASLNLPLIGGTLSGSLTDLSGFIGPLTGNTTGTNTGHSTLDLALTGGNLTGITTSNSSIRTSTLNSTLNASSCNLSPVPSWCSGSDLGAWLNAAATQLSGGGIITIESGSYNITTPIVIPGGVSYNIQGSGTENTIINYTPTTGTAFNFSGHGFMGGTLMDFTLNGPGAATSTTGFMLSASGGTSAWRVNVRNFGTGITFGNNNYVTYWAQSSIRANNIALNYPIGLSNSGENMIFDHVSLSNGAQTDGTSTGQNCVQILNGTSGTSAEFTFISSSFDACQVVLGSNNGLKVTMISPHFEQFDAVMDGPFVKCTSTDAGKHCTLNLLYPQFSVNAPTVTADAYIDLISYGELHMDTPRTFGFGGISAPNAYVGISGTGSAIFNSAGIFFQGAGVPAVISTTTGGNTPSLLYTPVFTNAPVNQTICWVASGILGHCTSIVGAGGACTCVQ